MADRTSIQQGFTIVEALIVLAIAGMIFLMIMLAVPTLQRNERNSRRKQDASDVLAAVSRYELNNSGNFPGVAGGVTFAASGIATFYSPTAFDTTSIKLFAETPGTATKTGSSVNSLEVYNYYRCKSDGSASQQGAGYRDTVALFLIETANGTQAQCESNGL